MATVSQPGLFNFQGLTSLGGLGAGMRLYTYVQGTTTHKTAYTNAAGTIAHTYSLDSEDGQYIALDARGELPAPLYLTSGAYDLCLKTSAGATVWTRRAESESADTTVFTQSGTGATARTVQAKGRDTVSVKDFGATGDGSTDDTAAIVAADAITTSVGMRLNFPPGTYKISSLITPSIGAQWEGAGAGYNVPILKAANSTSGLLILNTCQIRNLQVQGSVSTVGARVGTGIQLGNASYQPSFVTLDNVYVQHFQTGVRLAGTSWLTCQKLNCSNNQIGMDFNAASAVAQNVLMFKDCLWTSNERNGIAGTSTPVRNISVMFIGGNAENNGSAAPATYPQIALGTTGNFVIDGMYIEYSLGGTAPNAINSNGMSQGRISSCYFNTCNYGIYDGSGGTSQVFITGNRFLASTTADIYLPSCSQIVTLGNNYDRPTSNTISGGGSTDMLLGTGVASVVGYNFGAPAQMSSPASWTPVLASSGGGSNTYTLQTARFNQVGNQVFFQGRIVLATNGMSAGTLTITGLPNLSFNGAGYAYSLCQVRTAGFTASGSNTFVYGEVDPNTQAIALYQDGSVAGATQIVASQLSGTATLIFSGYYTIS